MDLERATNGAPGTITATASAAEAESCASAWSESDMTTPVRGANEGHDDKARGVPPFTLFPRLVLAGVTTVGATAHVPRQGGGVAGGGVALLKRPRGAAPKSVSGRRMLWDATHGMWTDEGQPPGEGSPVGRGCRKRRRGARGAPTDVAPTDAAPTENIRFVHIDSGAEDARLDQYMALCATLMGGGGSGYRLYGEFDWEFREPVLKSQAAREQGYRTLLMYSGEARLEGGATYRPLVAGEAPNDCFEVVMLRVAGTGRGVGSALLAALQHKLGESAVLLAEAVRGPRRDPRKVARFFTQRCGFEESREAATILDECYRAKERRFYVDQGVDVKDTCAVDSARRTWTSAWSGDAEADRRRARLTFSWNTIHAPYKLMWRGGGRRTQNEIGIGLTQIGIGLTQMVDTIKNAIRDTLGRAVTNLEEAECVLEQKGARGHSRPSERAARLLRALGLDPHTLAPRDAGHGLVQMVCAIKVAIRDTLGQTVANLEEAERALEEAPPDAASPAERAERLLRVLGLDPVTLVSLHPTDLLLNQLGMQA